MNGGRSGVHMDSPTISVIIPAYNEEAFLPRTLGCLFAQPGYFEIIVVDGGSTDRTLERARSYLSVRAVVSPKGRAVVRDKQGGLPQVLDTDHGPDQRSQETT